MKFGFTENDGLVTASQDQNLNTRKITVSNFDYSPSRSLGNHLNEIFIERRFFLAMDRGVENFNADFIACQANTNVQNPTPLKMSDLLKGL